MSELYGIHNDGVNEGSKKYFSGFDFYEIRSIGFYWAMAPGILKT
jgi:hypothetical protein